MYRTRDGLERNISCLVLLERQLCQLYKILLKKTEDLTARSLLHYIASDSLKHSVILEGILKEITGWQVNESNCDANIRFAQTQVSALSKDISKLKKIDNRRLASLAEGLADFESLLLEKYSTTFQLSIPHSQTGEAHPTRRMGKNIFELIVSDEERHQDALATIKRLPDKFGLQINDPFVRYQTPDAWYSPPTRLP